jgi:hypothetical protein
MLHVGTIRFRVGDRFSVRPKPDGRAHIYVDRFRRSCAFVVLNTPTGTKNAIPAARPWGADDLCGRRYSMSGGYRARDRTGRGIAGPHSRAYPNTERAAAAAARAIRQVDATEEENRLPTVAGGRGSGARRKR